MSSVINGQYKNGSPQAMAVQGGEQAPITDLNGRSGWLFNKDVAGTGKFNYFFYGQGAVALTLRDIKNMYCNISNDNYLGTSTNPFIIIYTKATGSGDISWYHSKITYMMPSSFNVQSGETITIHTHNIIQEQFGYRNCWLTNIATEGEALPTEEVLYISVQSDSAAPVNTQILVSQVGFETEHQFYPIKRNIKLISD